MNLCAGVVVIKLAGDVPAGGGQQAAEAVSHCRPPAVAHVQWAGGVGGDKLYLYLATVPDFAGAEGRALFKNRANHSLVAGIRQEEIDKPGAGDFSACHQRAGWQRIADQGGKLARIPLCRLGQGERDIAGQITVTLVAGAIDLYLRRDISGQQALINQRIQSLVDQPGEFFLHCREGIPGLLQRVMGRDAELAGPDLSSLSS